MIVLYSFNPIQGIHLEEKTTYILANPGHAKIDMQFSEMFHWHHYKFCLEENNNQNDPQRWFQDI